MNEEKKGAYRFLKSLQEGLNESSPPPDTLRSWVDETWKKPSSAKTSREKLESKENIPFYEFAIPKVFELGKATTKLTDQEMRRSLRCVYYSKFPEFSDSNVMRKAGHPFSKGWCLFDGSSENFERIYEAWRKPRTGVSLNQAWPEAGLSSPFPFRILFEAKYFELDSTSQAQKELIKAIYQTAYYRGLPPSSGWDYAIGCLIAYDVSPNADLKRAWEDVSSKHLFWEDANIFVMIVRAPENQA
jgi:hypothetical protein